MVAIHFLALTLSALFLVVRSTAAAPILDKRGSYVGFHGFTRVINKDSLLWYKPYNHAGIHMATAANTTGTPYKCYGGNSTIMPYVSDWQTFDRLWAINLPTCNTHNSAANNRLLRAKILQRAEETAVDARLVFMIIMQESSCNLKVPCTGPGGVNCGIMQAAPGSVSFDASDPANSIDRMIRDGLQGTKDRGGFAWLFDGANGSAWYGVGGGGHLYRSLRAYNSGRVVDQANLDATAGRGKREYVNDMANRVMGWDGKGRGCGY